jgi:hypothetical protein
MINETTGYEYRLTNTGLDPGDDQWDHYKLTKFTPLPQGIIDYDFKNPIRIAVHRYDDRNFVNGEDCRYRPRNPGSLSYSAQASLIGLLKGLLIVLLLEGLFHIDRFFALDWLSIQINLLSLFIVLATLKLTLDIPWKEVWVWTSLSFGIVLVIRFVQIQYYPSSSMDTSPWRFITYLIISVYYARWERFNTTRNLLTVLTKTYLGVREAEYWISIQCGMNWIFNDTPTDPKKILYLRTKDGLCLIMPPNHNDPELDRIMIELEYHEEIEKLHRFYTKEIKKMQKDLGKDLISSIK